MKLKNRKLKLFISVLCIIAIVCFSLWYYIYKWNVKSGLYNACADAKKIYVMVSDYWYENIYDNNEESELFIFSSEEKYDSDSCYSEEINQLISDSDFADSRYVIVIYENAIQKVIFSESKFSPYSGSYPLGHGEEYFNDASMKSISFNFNVKEYLNSFE